MFEFNVALRPQRPYGLLGAGSPGRPPRLSHSSCALNNSSSQCCFTSTETVRTIRDGEPRTATSTFTQLLSSVSVFVSALLYVHRNHQALLGTPRTATSTFTQPLSSDYVTRQILFTYIFAHAQWSGVRDLPEVRVNVSAGLLAKHVLYLFPSQ